MVQLNYWQKLIYNTPLVHLPGVQGVVVPIGTTDERSISPINGTIRYNTTFASLETYSNDAWTPIQTIDTNGEINTASNIGSGYGLFKEKDGVDLQFYSITAGTNVTISNIGDSIRISSNIVGEVNTASNIGDGTGEIFSTKTDSNIELRSLKSLSEFLTISNNGNTIDFDFPQGIGEINDAMNLGTGQGIYVEKTNTNIKLKSLTASFPLETTSNREEINIALMRNPTIPGLEYIRIPHGPSSEEPSPMNGMLRYDTNMQAFRGVINNKWTTFATSVSSFLSLTGGTITGHLNVRGISTFENNVVVGNNNSIGFQNGGKITFTRNQEDSGIYMGGASIQTQGGTINGHNISLIGNVINDIIGYDENNLTINNGFVANVSTINNGSLTERFVNRIIQGVNNQITVTNGNGINGDPIIGFSENVIFPGNSHIVIPTGSTTQRPVNQFNGMIRLNADSGAFEYYFGGTWRASLLSTGGVISGDLRFENSNIVMTGNETVDGRDLSVDGMVIDQINNIAPFSGFITKASDRLISRNINENPNNNLLGINVAGGDGSSPVLIGLNISEQENLIPLPNDQLIIYSTENERNGKITIEDITNLASDLLEIEFLPITGGFMDGHIVLNTGNIILSEEGTVDGRNLSNDGVIIDNINSTGSTGYIVRSDDPNIFAYREIMAITDSGIIVQNGDGVSENTEIGLDFNPFTLSDSVNSNTELLIWNNTDEETSYSKTNINKITNYVNETLHSEFFRASVNPNPLSNGLNTVRLIADNDLNINDSFNDDNGNYQFEPTTEGVYKIGVFVEFTSSAAPGVYIVNIQKNGTNQGNYASINVDGTNVFTEYFEDIYLAANGDNFKMVVDNTSGTNSEINSATFFAYKIFST